jgi:luciferase family oxidoreductase group 1
MRRTLQGGDEFPQDVVELMAYFQPVQPNQAIQAVPGAGTNVPIWILGSSTFGAQLAAILGLPFAFASRFAPGMMTQAMEIYRAHFKPSAQLAKPNVMLGLNVVAADTDEEARFLFSSQQQSFLNIRRGRPGRLPPPLPDFDSLIDNYGRAMLNDSLACAIVGGPDKIGRGLEEFVQRTGADELMVTTNIFDHTKRKRSFEILAGVWRGLTPPQPRP